MNQHYATAAVHQRAWHRALLLYAPYAVLGVVIAFLTPASRSMKAIKQRGTYWNTINPIGMRLSKTRRAPLSNADATEAPSANTRPEALTGRDRPTLPAAAGHAGRGRGPPRQPHGARIFALAGEESVPRSGEGTLRGNFRYRSPDFAIRAAMAGGSRKLTLAKKHLARVLNAWPDPTDRDDLSLYGFYCLEAAVEAAALHAGLKTKKNHWEKAELAEDLHGRLRLPDAGALLRDLNEARKAAAYDDVERPELDAEDIALQIEQYVAEVSKLIEGGG
ncbi:MAG: hypothetical protein ACT4P4_03330 [Betaproteobacteria bacterium]